jgi:UPF0716 protein FxsA
VLRAVLLLLVAAFLVAEIALLVLVGEWTRWQFLLGEMLLTGAFGWLVIRYLPARFRRAMNEAALEGRLMDGAHNAHDGALEAYLVLLAGILLIIPGIVSDVLGLLLLIPPIRLLVIAGVHRCRRAPS